MSLHKRDPRFSCWVAPEVRFNLRVDRGGDCWLWLGVLNNKGYGILRVGGKPTLAHRYSLALHLGHELPAGMECCHRCDNPRCVRPDHLFLGTHAENMADRDAKGRSCVRKNLPRGENNPAAILTWDRVRELRRSYTGKHGDIAKLARSQGLNPEMVRQVVRGETWVEQP